MKGDGADAGAELGGATGDVVDDVDDDVGAGVGFDAVGAGVVVVVVVVVGDADALGPLYVIVSVVCFVVFVVEPSGLVVVVVTGGSETLDGPVRRGGEA